MRRYRILTFALLSLFLGTLASLAPQPAAAAEAQTPAPGMARVWFLRSAQRASEDARNWEWPLSTQLSQSHADREGLLWGTRMRSCGKG